MIVILNNLMYLVGGALCSGGGGGGSHVPVQENGITVVPNPTAINFLGSGVSVVNNSNIADITVPGGGGGVSPGAPNLSVQFNNGGVFGGNSNFVFDATLQNLVGHNFVGSQSTLGSSLSQTFNPRASLELTDANKTLLLNKFDDTEELQLIVDPNFTGGMIWFNTSHNRHRVQRPGFPNNSASLATLFDGVATLQGNVSVQPMSIALNFTGAGVTVTNDIVGLQQVLIDIPGGTGGSPGGSDTQLQFNDATNFGGIPGATYNKVTQQLVIGDEMGAAIIYDAVAGSITLQNVQINDSVGTNLIVNGADFSVVDGSVSKEIHVSLDSEPPVLMMLENTTDYVVLNTHVDSASYLLDNNNNFIDDGFGNSIVID